MAISKEQRKRGQDSFARLQQVRIQHGVKSARYKAALTEHEAVVRDSLKAARQWCDAQGTEGQDRENYTDTQDRENYSHD